MLESSSDLRKRRSQSDESAHKRLTKFKIKWIFPSFTDSPTRPHKPSKQDQWIALTNELRIFPVQALKSILPSEKWRHMKDRASNRASHFISALQAKQWIFSRQKYQERLDEQLHNVKSTHFMVTILFPKILTMCENDAHLNTVNSNSEDIEVHRHNLKIKYFHYQNILDITCGH